MRARPLVAVALAALLAACSNPVPASKSAYVGHWHSPQMALLIAQDGNVEYRRQEGGTKKSIFAPLKGFQGDDFVVGAGPVTTTFKVTAPPHKDGDTMKMTVDGVELVRSDAPTDPLKR